MARLKASEGRSRAKHHPRINPGIPHSERDHLFCQHYLEHFDVVRAYAEAGFKKNGGTSTRAAEKLARFADYLAPMIKAKSERVVEKLVFDQSDILQTMARIGFANIQDYYIKTDRIMMQKVPDPTAEEGFKLEPVLYDGKPVYHMDPKPLYELTREQALAVEPTMMFGRMVGYHFPSAKVRHQYLESLGKQEGMFLDKVILERHNHLHQHAHMDFGATPSEALGQIVHALKGMVPTELVQLLGFDSEDYANETQEKGRIIEVIPEQREE